MACKRSGVRISLAPQVKGTMRSCEDLLGAKPGAKCYDPGTARRGFREDAIYFDHSGQPRDYRRLSTPGSSTTRKRSPDSSAPCGGARSPLPGAVLVGRERGGLPAGAAAPRARHAARELAARRRIITRQHLEASSPRPPRNPYRNIQRHTNRGMQARSRDLMTRCSPVGSVKSGPGRVERPGGKTASPGPASSGSGRVLTAGAASGQADAMRGEADLPLHGAPPVRNR